MRTYSLDWREGDMKKTKKSLCVCASSKVKNHQNQTFHAENSANQSFLISGFWPMIFFQVEKPTNQRFPISSSRLIRFLGAENSVNQRFLSCCFRPMRFFHTENPANEMFSISRSRPIRFFWVVNLANKRFSTSGFWSIGWQTSQNWPIRCQDLKSRVKQVWRPQKTLQYECHALGSVCNQMCGVWSNGMRSQRSDESAVELWIRTENRGGAWLLLRTSDGFYICLRSV